MAELLRAGGWLFVIAGLGYGGWLTSRVPQIDQNGITLLYAVWCGFGGALAALPFWGLARCIDLLEGIYAKWAPKKENKEAQ